MMGNDLPLIDNCDSFWVMMGNEVHLINSCNWGPGHGGERCVFVSQL